MNLEISNDAVCGSDPPDGSVMLKVDGQCNEVQYIDGTTVAYKATPIPPDPQCLSTYEEFESETACKAGSISLPANDAKVTFPFLMGGSENEPNRKHFNCHRKGENSRRTMCITDPYSPATLVSYETHIGDDKCEATGANLKKVALSVSSECESAQKPDGLGKFYYKASPAKCFNWYTEFKSEEDCNNNQDPVEDTEAAFPFLMGLQNDVHSYDKRCSVLRGNAYRTTCGIVDNGATEDGVPDAKTIIERWGLSSCDGLWTKKMSGQKPKTSASLQVDGTCHNFEWEGKTVWYKAVQTTDTAQYRPGTEPPLADTATCKDNKLINAGDANGKRCVQLNNKPQVCSSMGFG